MSDPPGSAGARYRAGRAYKCDNWRRSARIPCSQIAKSICAKEAQTPYRVPGGPLRGRRDYPPTSAAHSSAMFWDFKPARSMFASIHPLLQGGLLTSLLGRPVHPPVHPPASRAVKAKSTKALLGNRRARCAQRLMEGPAGRNGPEEILGRTESASGRRLMRMAHTWWLRSRSSPGPVIIGGKRRPYG